MRPPPDASPSPDPAPAPRRARPEALAFAGMLAAAWIAALGHLLLLARVHPEADPIHGHDDRHYLATARSLWCDGDLHFANEFARLLPEALEAPPTPAGRPPNKYGVGMPLLAGPPLVAARLAGIGGEDTLGTGAQVLYAAWFAALALGGVGMAGAILAACVGPRAGFLAAAALLPGSSLLWYAVLQPTMAHGTTVFLGALLLWGWSRRYLTDDARLRWPLVMGLAVGLSAATRWQDAPLGVLFVVAEGGRLAAALRAGSPERARATRAALAAAALFGGGLLAGVAPQLAYQRVVWGAWLTDAYAAGGEGFRWAEPAFLGLLFSSRNALVFYAPLSAVALAGLIAAAARDARRVAWAALLAAVVVNVYVNAAWWAWWMGHAFGARGLLNSWVMLAAGLAWLFARARGWSRPARVALAGAVVAAIAWCLLLMALYETSAIPHDGSGWDLATLPARAAEMAGRVLDKAARALGAGAAEAR